MRGGRWHSKRCRRATLAQFPWRWEIQAAFDGSTREVCSMTRVAIAGLGAIGRVVARSLADGIPGLVLAGVASRDRAKAQAWLEAQQIACPLVELEAFPGLADLAVECAPAALLERICRPMLEAGKTVMVLSAGALLPRPDLVALAKQHGGQIIVP